MTTQPQTLYGIPRPDGGVSLRALHTGPAITLQRAEQDHTTEWIDLQARGYRLATLTIAVTEIHSNAFAAIQRHAQKSTQPPCSPTSASSH